MTQHDTLLIIDFGSQLTQLIARRVREIQVYSEVVACDVSTEWLQQFATTHSLKGIILSGSHASVYSETEHALQFHVTQAVFELGVPVLGICFGMQMMAKQLGGKVASARALGSHCEFGLANVRARGHTALLKDIEDYQTPEGHGMLKVWMSHGDQVTQLPPGFVIMANTQGCPIAAMADETRNFYGLQFHPEVTHTPQGKRILERFARDICQARADWVMMHYSEVLVEATREQVADGHVILGLSGGVDSSVAAAIISKAIGDQLHCIFVDHGLLRLNEAAQVKQMFEQNWHIDLISVDASALFFEKLKGITDPESKRKIIGALFIEVFQHEAEKLQQQLGKSAKFLAQGTIYPDVIESGAAKKAVAIKSHHNVGGLPQSLKLKLLEPLRNLFKDEVRELGLALGLPTTLIYRHPFPGPGLAVRILGEIKPDYVHMLQAADAIFIEELRNNYDPQTGQDWYALTSQAFVVFIPERSVGVVGDGRSYDYIVALRAVQTSDFMTADWAALPRDLLQRTSNRICNEVKGIGRVTYDITSKPPATIEWE